jgi:hypothetical protein
MTDNDELMAAFVAGFAAGRYRGNPNADLHPVSQRAAENIFENWSQHD